MPVAVELVKKFPSIYGPQRFITLFISVRHYTIWWSTWSGSQF